MVNLKKIFFDQKLILYPEHKEVGAEILEDAVVSGIFSNPLNVKPQGVFVAIKGLKFDSHQLLGEAIQKGARYLVVERLDFIPNTFVGWVCLVPSSKRALALLASRFYDEPTRGLFVVGVTGTNGKTSTSYLVEHFLQSFGSPCAVIGTVNHHLGTQVWSDSEGMTTPDSLHLQMRLREMQNSGAKSLAIEISSHALDQDRAVGVHLDLAIFTNLTQDHLDYHQSFENYYQAKKKLFTDLLIASEKKEKRAVLNTDDAYGKRMAEELSLISSRNFALLKFAQDGPDADIVFKIQSVQAEGTSFTLTVNAPKLMESKGQEGSLILSPGASADLKLKQRLSKLNLSHYEFFVPLFGEHNVYNVVGVLAGLLANGFAVSDLVKAALTFSGIPGRLERVRSKQALIFVDYAHTPDALLKVLRTVRQMHEQLGWQKRGGRIFCLFGSGGDRDPGKRPLMGQVAAQESDVVVLTSDNPRFEDPVKIIEAVRKGYDEVPLPRSHELHIVVDRAEAIAFAVSRLTEVDILLIAGKGHENYQDVKGKKYPFQDAVLVREALGE